VSDTTERPATTTSPYQRIGGEAGLHRLVDAFYRIMDTDPRAAEIRAMHGPDLSRVNQGVFEWLSGWLGGPPIYIARKGTPCLTSPHRAYAIGETARDQWMLCMRQALAEVEMDPTLRAPLEQAFERLAGMVQNRR